MFLCILFLYWNNASLLLFFVSTLCGEVSWQLAAPATHLLTWEGRPLSDPTLGKKRKLISVYSPPVMAPQTLPLIRCARVNDEGSRTSPRFFFVSAELLHLSSFSPCSPSLSPPVCAHCPTKLALKLRPDGSRKRMAVPWMCVYVCVSVCVRVQWHIQG